jgi:5-methylcytosine-specific restriction endonuclease McrA
MGDHQQALVLDQGFRPIEIVSWQRAISLWVEGKAEVIEEYDEEVRSAFLVIKVPAVIRLVKRFRRDDKAVRFSRINVYARDDYRCQYCGDRCSMSELTYDHVIPRAQGGKTVWANIVSACSDCNGRKKNRTPAQAGMRLLKEPVQPTKPPAVLIRISRDRAPQQWLDYLYWTGELEQG